MWKEGAGGRGVAIQLIRTNTNPPRARPVLVKEAFQTTNAPRGPRRGHAIRIIPLGLPQGRVWETP